jgi:DNA-binding transcriptional regulator YhcF (GntR family)
MSEGYAIDAGSLIPQYVQLAGIMKAKFVAYGIPIGSSCPTEAQLADKYGVSRDVARRAYLLLDELGYTKTKRGVGRFTARAHTTEIIRPKADSKVLARMALPGESLQLGLVPGDPLIVVKEPGRQPVIYDARRSVVEFTGA